VSEVSEVTAAQLMSSPAIAVTTRHSVAVAWQAIRARQVHHLVVLDEHGLAAVIDDRTLAAHWPGDGPESPHSVRLGDVVVRGARCVLPDEPAAAVARLMIAGRCDAVPVVTAAGFLLGLVTATDVVAAVARGAVPVVARADSTERAGT
jgi:CBS-domain-containing membrane protein